MQFLTFSSKAVAVVAAASGLYSGAEAYGSYGHAWQAPTKDAVRGPCPMLNSLANHGYLPRNGKDITLNITIDALGTALNIDPVLSEYLYDEAITTNPDYPNATVFSLANLVTHDILEHDASLSRVDYYFGNPQPFNQAIFDQTRSHWTADIITVTMAANARYARVQTSNKTNPTFGLSELGSAFGYGESAAYIGLLGDKTSGTVRKNIVEYLFASPAVAEPRTYVLFTENERLPTELGWHKVTETFTFDNLLDLMDRIMALTPGVGINATESAAVARRGRMHNARRVFH
ncbi:sterigmatocystin biosynthesis peroxidase stcC protein [Rutstroemia sp. NJR-2017a WRK4]|nr:sterigmatocystin biosynthesis peroxidase stcC protein [Rutstroemia sp. NJR-2017a WRK4]